MKVLNPIASIFLTVLLAFNLSWAADEGWKKIGEAEVIHTPEMKSEGDVLYIYNRTDMPTPVSDRDAVIRNVWSIDKSTGIIYFHAETVKTSYRQEKNVIRMPLSIIHCTLIPEGDSQTKVIYQTLGDPGGTLPSFLVNILTRDLGIKTIAGLRKVVPRDEFKNIRTVVTKTEKTKRSSIVHQSQ